MRIFFRYCICVLFDSHTLTLTLDTSIPSLPAPKLLPPRGVQSYVCLFFVVYVFFVCYFVFVFVFVFVICYCFFVLFFCSHTLAPTIDTKIAPIATPTAATPTAAKPTAAPTPAVLEVMYFYVFFFVYVIASC